MHYRKLTALFLLFSTFSIASDIDIRREKLIDKMSISSLRSRVQKKNFLSIFRDENEISCKAFLVPNASISNFVPLTRRQKKNLLIASNFYAVIEILNETEITQWISEFNSLVGYLVYNNTNRKLTFALEAVIDISSFNILSMFHIYNMKKVISFLFPKIPPVLFLYSDEQNTADNNAHAETSEIVPFADNSAAEEKETTFENPIRVLNSKLLSLVSSLWRFERIALGIEPLQLTEEQQQYFDDESSEEEKKSSSKKKRRARKKKKDNIVLDAIDQGTYTVVAKDELIADNANMLNEGDVIRMHINPSASGTRRMFPSSSSSQNDIVLSGSFYSIVPQEDYLYDNDDIDSNFNFPGETDVRGFLNMGAETVAGISECETVVSSSGRRIGRCYKHYASVRYSAPQTSGSNSVAPDDYYFSDNRGLPTESNAEGSFLNPGDVTVADLSSSGNRSRKQGLRVCHQEEQTRSRPSVRRSGMPLDELENSVSQWEDGGLGDDSGVPVRRHRKSQKNVGAVVISTRNFVPPQIAKKKKHSSFFSETESEYEGAKDRQEAENSFFSIIAEANSNSNSYSPYMEDDNTMQGVLPPSVSSYNSSYEPSYQSSILPPSSIPDVVDLPKPIDRENRQARYDNIRNNLQSITEESEGGSSSTVSQSSSKQPQIFQEISFPTKVSGDKTQQATSSSQSPQISSHSSHSNPIVKAVSARRGEFYTRVSSAYRNAMGQLVKKGKHGEEVPIEGDESSAFSNFSNIPDEPSDREQ